MELLYGHRPAQYYGFQTFSSIGSIKYRSYDVASSGKLTKPNFDTDSIASSAEELKYVGSLKRAIGNEYKEPSAEFAKLLTRHVYDGRFSSYIKEKFEPLVGKALKQFLSEQVNDRLKTALGADDVKTTLPVQPGEASQNVQGTGDDATAENRSMELESDIVTTDEEWTAYLIVEAIACSNVDPERVTMRDAKEYCAIFLMITIGNLLHASISIESRNISAFLMKISNAIEWQSKKLMTFIHVLIRYVKR